MKQPFISSEPARTGARYITINGQRVGPALPEPYDFVVWNWLEESWDDIVAMIANSQSGMQQRAAPSSVRKIEAETKHVAKVLEDAKKRKVRK